MFESLYINNRNFGLSKDEILKSFEKPNPLFEGLKEQITYDPIAKQFVIGEVVFDMETEVRLFHLVLF